MEINPNKEKLNPYFASELLAHSPFAVQSYASQDSKKPAGIYTYNSKWGIKYVAHPFLIKYLGLTEEHPNEENIEAFIRFLTKKFRYGEYAFKPEDTELVQKIIRTHFEKIKIRSFLTYRLPLTLPYEALHANYKRNVRKNLKKHQIKHQPKIIDPTKILHLHNAPENNHIPKPPKNFEARWDKMTKHHSIREKSISYGIMHENKLVAASYFVELENWILYMLCMTTNEGRKIDAHTKILDYVIWQYANSGKTLDFSGGNMENIGRFFGSFGAIPQEYIRIYWNDLPFPINKIKKHKL